MSNSKIQDKIKSFSEEYSFLIPSELFYQLTTEQQKLWKKEIEDAIVNGVKYGLELSES